MVKQKGSCIACDSVRNGFYGKVPSTNSGLQEFVLLKCNNCGMVFLEDTTTDYNKNYPEDYYGAQNSKFFIAQKIFSNLRAQRLSFLPDGALILDFGCGNGSFLETMQQKGYSVVGIEHSNQAKKIAAKNIPIYFCAIDKLPKEQLFNAITMWQVLEHLNNPNKVLSEIRKRLKDNGTLLISVVNRESFQARLSKGNWLHLDIPYHVGHYSVSALKKILEKNGFQIEKISQFSLEYGPFGLAQSVMNMLGLEKNIIYRRIKHHEKFPKTQTALAFLLLPLLLSLGTIVELIASLMNQGAVIEIIAKKR